MSDTEVQSITSNLSAENGTMDDSFLSSIVRRLAWLAIPIAAIVAYSLTLRVGFLGDDFILLELAHRPGVDFGVLLPSTSWFFYRPVGALLTWELGWQLWGYNPVPYHLTQLLLHAAVSLILGLWLAYATGRKGLGWLAGMLFAVFPLHAEAVGWLAAQWDLLAALFGLMSLWCFTAWWRARIRNEKNPKSKIQNPKLLYVAALILYGLAIFTKESWITFVPLFGMAVWLVAVHPSQAQNSTSIVHRPSSIVLLALLPFFGLVALNMGLRFALTGSLGNYAEARYDFGEFIWDYTSAYLRRLFAPVNPAVFGEPAVQFVGLLSTAWLVFGIVWFGRAHRRLLLFAGAWVVLTLLPVVNLSRAFTENLQDSRLLYLPSMGYCIAIAVLLYAALAAARRYRTPLLAVIAALLLLSGIAAWIQTMPWHMASRQAGEVVAEFFRVVPVQPRPNGMVWYVENTPQRYKGANVLYWGLGLSRILADENATHPKVERSPDATQAPLTSNDQDAYAVRLKFDESDQLWHADYAAGLTRSSEPPTPAEAGSELKVWDFRGCSSRMLESWIVREARARCESGRGLALQPTSDDPQMVSANLRVEQPGKKVRFVRLRAAVRYPASEDAAVEAPLATPYNTQPLFSQWFWRGPGTDYAVERIKTLPLKQDGEPHVYWTYIPASEVGSDLTGLRFDPVNAPVESEVQWIAIDLVE